MKTTNEAHAGLGEALKTTSENLRESIAAANRLKGELNGKLSEAERASMIIRFVDVESSALASVIQQSVSMSAKLASELISHDLENGGKNMEKLREAVAMLRSGNILGASTIIGYIDDSALSQKMSELNRQWRSAEKVLQSYFTKREIEALSERIPFIHNDTFSYMSEYANDFDFRTMEHTIKETVRSVAKQIEAENLIGMVVSTNQQTISFEQEERLFPVVENDDDELLSQGIKL